jgi:hypothetical protein
MKDHEIEDENINEVNLNTNEVMRDYEFYLKMYIEDQVMDFEEARKKAS